MDFSLEVTGHVSLADYRIISFSLSLDNLIIIFRHPCGRESPEILPLTHALEKCTEVEPQKSIQFAVGRSLALFFLFGTWNSNGQMGSTLAGTLSLAELMKIPATFLAPNLGLKKW